MTLAGEQMGSTMQRGKASVVESVQAGRVEDLVHHGHVVQSAIRKSALPGDVLVTLTGIVGDEQAETEHHGGSDKALCAYPAEHYGYWEERLERSLRPGAFGENLTLSGLTESDACIGDSYRLGGAIIQISQPRQPCYKLAALYEVPKLALWVQQSGRTGFYFRVLLAGTICAGDELELLERPHPDLTIQEANRVKYHDRGDLAMTRRLLVHELSVSWRQAFTKRLLNEADPSDSERLDGIYLSLLSGLPPQRKN